VVLQRAIELAQVARQRLPQGLLEDQEPRTSSSGVGRTRRISSVSQQAAISRRSVSTTASRSQTVRSGRSFSASARAIRSYFWSSVRRTISVGWAVSTSSISSEQTASRSCSAVSPAPTSRPKVSSHEPRCGGRSGACW
jgi:hypothetical protein